MEISEVKTLKRKTEKDISDLINNIYKKTGCTIEELSLGTPVIIQNGLGETIEIFYPVDMKISL